MTDFQLGFPTTCRSYATFVNPLDNIGIVLVEPSSPGNVGAVARVMKTTGLRNLTLVNPGAWDTPEARWMARSEDVLDRCQIRHDLASAIADAHFVVGATHRFGRLRDIVTTPREAIADLAPKAKDHAIALVFGREKDGLWRRELLLCHQLVRFPSAVSYPSFNLSHAVLLFAYEFFHALREVEPLDVDRQPVVAVASAADRERVYDHIGEAMQAIDFRPYNDDPYNFSRALRRFFDQRPLVKRDVMVIHKMCAQIVIFARRMKSVYLSTDDTPPPGT